jgi:hypothetical protein
MDRKRNAKSQRDEQRRKKPRKEELERLEGALKAFYKELRVQKRSRVHCMADTYQVSKITLETN